MTDQEMAAAVHKTADDFNKMVDQAEGTGFRVRTAPLVYFKGRIKVEITRNFPKLEE